VRGEVDHTLTNQSSTPRLIEDNWGIGRIGNGSFRCLDSSLGNISNFSNLALGAHRLFLGQPPAKAVDSRLSWKMKRILLVAGRDRTSSGCLTNSADSS
jgi:hypothetical protein